MKDDGGPAFASNISDNSEIKHIPGMSLRDWYIGMALSGLTSDDDLPIEGVGKLAVQAADEAMEARGKP